MRVISSFIMYIWQYEVSIIRPTVDLTVDDKNINE